MAARHKKRRIAEVVPPHAGRMTAALTGLDYDFERAVADLVDNSITAGAKRIWVEIRSDTESNSRLGPNVVIIDDGKGMSQAELIRAMQYGAASSEDQDGLGKFGLGMKTASTSQANIVAVASRATKSGAFAVRAWDLEYLENKERWILLAGDVGEFPTIVKRKLRGLSGTAVLWRNLVRALPNLKRQSDAEKDWAMNEFAGETIEHLSMVFNRFLSGNTTGRRRKVKIWVNGNLIEPQDPLLRAHPKTQLRERKSFVVRKEDGEEATFFMQPALLPRQDQFVDAEGGVDREAHKKAGGPRGWNAGQGFYVYRLDRLIQGGGWSYLRAVDEHAKTARIDVDLTRSSDDLFSLNVSKTRILLPKAVKEEIREYTAKVVSLAKIAYNKHHGNSKKKPKKSPKKLPGHGPKQVLNTLYSSCTNQTEKKTLMKIVKREYPGYRPPKEK